LGNVDGKVVHVSYTSVRVPSCTGYKRSCVVPNTGDLSLRYEVQIVLGYI